MANVVRTFGDDQMRNDFAKVEITKLPEHPQRSAAPHQHHQSESGLEVNAETKLLINEAMLDIEFNFSKIGEEELRLIAGGMELKEKWQRTITAFTQNFDQDDPEFITLRDAFTERFKQRAL